MTTEAELDQILAEAFGRAPAEVSPELRAVDEAAAVAFGRAPTVDAALLKDFRAVGLSEAAASKAVIHVRRGDDFESAAILAEAFDDTSRLDRKAVTSVVEARKPKPVPARVADLLASGAEPEAGKRRMTDAEYQRMQTVFIRLVDATEASHGWTRDASISEGLTVLKECQAITVARAETFSEFLGRMDERAQALRSTSGTRVGEAKEQFTTIREAFDARIANHTN